MKKVMIAFATLSILATAPAFADGDVKKGKKVFKKCKSCHKIKAGKKGGSGPTLNSIFGRTAGTYEGFKFSTAMAAKGAEGLVWNAETLAEFVKGPKRYMKGTKMSYAGLLKKKHIGKEKKEAKANKKVEDLLAYLKTFSPDAE